MKKVIKYILIFCILIGIGGISETFPIFGSKIQKSVLFAKDPLLIIQGNSLSGIYPLPEPKVVKKMRAIVTGYSSTVWQTDEDPLITAAGTRVRDGIVANNLLPFGTRIRIPELYDEKIFVVEDRMHWKKGYYHFDIWFPSYQEAKNFGVKRTYIEVLES